MEPETCKDEYQKLITNLNRILSWLHSINFAKLKGNIIPAFSLATLNFSVYIHNFSSNTIMLIDHYSVINYFFGMIVLFILILGVTRVSLFIFRQSCEYINILIFQDDERKSRFINLINDNFIHDILLYYISSVVFLYIFCGYKSLLDIHAIIFIALIFVAILHNNSIISRFSQRKKSSKIKIFISLFIIFTKKWAYRNFIEKHLLIVLFVLSILIGNYRSDHVKKNFVYEISMNKNSMGEYIIFLTSKSGIFAWSENDAEVKFMSWDNGISVKDKQSRL